MSQGTFRNANSREAESLITYFVEEKHMTRQAAEDVVEEAHVGILEPFQGNTPSYIGKVMIVFHQNVSMYEVYKYSDKGNLEEIKQEG
jgi:hypothetical protein